MKCKICKKRMLSVLISYEFSCSGKTMTATNVPAKQCPECGNIEILDLIKERLQRYAHNCKGTSIDYTKCENDEAADIVATQMFL